MDWVQLALVNTVSSVPIKGEELLCQLRSRDKDKKIKIILQKKNCENKNGYQNSR